MKTETKNEMIHIRIPQSTKDEAEGIFRKLGITFSYAISLFLNQVILKNGFPFDIKIPKNDKNEIEVLARALESTGGKGNLSKEDEKILHLYSTGEIDYETAIFAIQR